MKKLLSVLIIATMLVAGISLVGCTDTEQTSEASTYKYVSLKINPEVEFIVDENGEVESVNPLNEDAEILLSDVDLTNEPIEDATETVVDLATEAGYIDVDTDGKEVEVCALDQEGNDDEIMYEKIEKGINQYFENHGIFGKVTKDTLDEYAQQAIDLGYSVGQTKLMMLAIDKSGKTLDEIKDMKMGDIVKIIHNNNVDKQSKGKNGNQNQGLKQQKQQKCDENAQKIQEHKNNTECNQEQIAEQIKQWQNSNNN